MTITPQAYQDGDSLLRDEILISNDAGTTWRRAHSGLISSPVTISAWSNSWSVVSIGDTQMPGSALDAGRFNPGSAPSFDIFLLTESSTFSTVSLRLWDTITGSQASMFAGLVQLVYRGQIASGTGALTSGSGVAIWQGSEASTASITVSGFANQVHKFELTFLGYPPSLPALSLGFELSINRVVYSIDLADDWAEGSLWLNPDKQFLWPPLKPTSTGGNVTIERFVIAGSGVALLNSGQLTRTLANGTHWLSISPTGEVSLGTTVPAGNYTIAKAIVSGNVLTRVFPACTFRAQRLVGPAGAGLVPYRFINFSNGLLVPSAGTTGSTVRVSTNSTGAHVTSGFALVEAGEAISVGSNIQADSNGKAINESGIGLGVALSEAYADGDLILVQLITASEGGGAITPGEVRDALAGLTGANRLDASAIKNLPSIPTSTQIRDSLQTLTGSNRLNASAIFGITSALEALTGADRLDASAIKNLPAEPSGMQVRLALETLSGNLRLNASAIQGLPAEPTGAQIRDALAGLTGTNRLDANAIKGLPSVPNALSQLTNDTNFTTLAGVASVGYLTSVPDNSVSTSKVQDGAITNAKLASGIDASKITTGTIPSARLDTGTSANKIVQLDGNGRLPALDGSQLTNLPSGGASITVQDEGSTLTTALTSINFTGAGVTSTNSGGDVTVNVPGAGSEVSILSDPFASSVVLLAPLEFNFEDFSTTNPKNWSVSGSPVVQFTESRFNTGSALFASTSDSIRFGSSTDWDLTSADFTIEGWFNFSASPTVNTEYHSMMHHRNPANIAEWTWTMGIFRNNGVNELLMTMGGSNSVLTTNIALNTWYFVQITRAGSTLRMFVNGAMVSSVTLSNVNSFDNNRVLAIGGNTTDSFRGRVTGVRITKGVARANVVPTRRFVSENASLEPSIGVHLASVPLANGSFELPAISNNSFDAGAVLTGWTMVGNKNYSIGHGSGGGFSAPSPTPYGSQFLIANLGNGNTGTLTQTINSDNLVALRVSYSYAIRGGYQNNIAIELLINGVVVESFTGYSNTSWVRRTTPWFQVPRASTTTLGIRLSSTNSADQTTFLDHIEVEGQFVTADIFSSNNKFANAITNNLQLFRGNHLLSSGFTARLPQSPTEMDFVYVNTIKSPQTLVTNQTNVDGLIDGVWTITLSQQPHPIPVWFQGGKWNTHIPFITNFTLDPAIGVNLSTFTSHSAPSGIFDFLGRVNGTSQNYTNPINGTIISATSSGHLDTHSADKIADRLRGGNNDIFHGSNSASPEWMQIQFLGGRSVRLSQFSIRASNQHNINRFILSGSNDGTNFTNIWDSGTNIQSSADVLSPANLSSVYYTYFRFTEVGEGSVHFCIGEVELYGILKLS